MTGTPIQNRWEDLASLLHFLKVCPDQDLRHVTALLKHTTAGSEMAQILATICLRRSKTAISLPEKRDKIHRVEFDTEEAIVYRDAKDTMIRLLQWGCNSTDIKAYSNVLVRINALRQICNLGTYTREMDSSAPACETQSDVAQALFDNMIANGTALCTKCGDDLSTLSDFRDPNIACSTPERPSITFAAFLSVLLAQTPQS